MSEEENKPKRTVRITLDRKFGVSEAPERRPRRNDDERGSFGDKPSFRGDRGDRRFDRDRGDRRFDRGERRFDRGRVHGAAGLPHLLHPTQRCIRILEHVSLRVLPVGKSRVDA